MHMLENMQTVENKQKVGKHAKYTKYTNIHKPYKKMALKFLVKCLYSPGAENVWVWFEER